MGTDLLVSCELTPLDEWVSCAPGHLLRTWSTVKQMVKWVLVCAALVIAIRLELHQVWWEFWTEWRVTVP